MSTFDPRKTVAVPIFVLLFLTPLAFSDHTETGFVLFKWVVAQVLLIFAAVAWLTGRRTRREKGFVKTRLDAPIAFFFVLSVLSMGSASNLTAGLKRLTIIFFCIMLYVLAANNVRHFAQARKYLLAIAAATTVISLLGLVEYCCEYSARAPASAQVSRALSSQLERLFSGLLVMRKPPTHQIQMWATLGNSNLIAQSIAAGLPVSLAFFLHGVMEKRTFIWIASALSFLVMSITVFLTGSKGAWAGIGAAFIISSLIWLTLSFGRRRMFLLALVMIASAVPVLAYTAGRTFPATVDSADIDPTTASGRMTMWKSTLRMIREKPLLGSGPGSFFTSFPGYILPDYHVILGQRRPRQAHNDYLQIAAETGIPSLIALCAAAGIGLCGISRLVRVLARRPGTDSFFATAILAAVSGTMVHSFFDFNLQMPVPLVCLWFMLGSAEGIRTASEHTQPLPVPGRESGCPSLFSSVLVWILPLVMIFATVVFTLMPFIATICYQKGTSLVRGHDTPRAIACIKAATRLDPGFVEARSTLGSLYGQEDMNDAGIRELAAAAALDPYDAITRINLAEAYAQKKDFRRALSEAARAVRLRPRFAPASATLGNIHRRMGDLEAAERELRKSIELDPAFKPAYLYLAAVYRARGLDEQADALLEE